MNRKNLLVSIVVVIITCLLSTGMIGLILADSYAQSQYETLSELTQQLVTKYPDDTQDIVGFIKNSRQSSANHDKINQDFLSGYGYQPEYFALRYRTQSLITAFICTCIILFCFFLLYYIWKKNCKQRIGDLTTYLEKINMEKDVTILPPIEDDFSLLQDEIYKTITKLYQTKEQAVLERQNFADNLANISHQLKTPVTSISIMLQLYEKEQNPYHLEQMKKKTLHLQQLIDALLTLSRIDVGVLKMEKQQVDVYSMLQMSVEAVDDIIRRKKIQVTLPNHPEIQFEGDMEWSVEAFMNLIKNCAEHTPDKGKLSIDYTQNPLYTELMIHDNGQGFAEKELPNIFERFYQGERALKTGVGIGLSLSKSIIEMQNGFIQAKNLPEGGACFAVRFYRH